MDIEPADHADCADWLRRQATAKGVEVTVSTAPPIVAGPYETAGFRCPHGVALWIEPTGEQIADWVARGVR